MAEHPNSRLITFRNAFLTGLLLLAPLVVTLWALATVIEIVGGNFRPIFLFYLPESIREHSYLNLFWDIIATMMVVLLVTCVGYISRYVFGKYLISIAERAIQTIPGANAVYNTVKQIMDTFSTQKRNLFTKAVLVQFPRQGLYSVGFITNKAQGEPQAKTTDEVWTVFVPTTPNPTTGFLIMLPQSDIIELDMSVGDAMKLIISGGTVVPPWPADKVVVQPQ
jgi:uncharacterized membrane protein